MATGPADIPGNDPQLVRMSIRQLITGSTPLMKAITGRRENNREHNKQNFQHLFAHV
jgi:hypothetical protein